MKRLIKQESGAAIILVTASLLVLMGVAAVVVDGGAGFSERRQAQSAVDFASLAALQEAVSCSTSCDTQDSADNGAAEAVARVAGNLPGRTLIWGDCEDPSRPGKFEIVANGNECVSFTKNFDESRVVLPDDNVKTTFGRVLGFSSLTVSATAEAGQESSLRVKAIPHTPTGTAGSEGCLLSDQAPQTVEPCSGAASGFYGYLDIALYGSDDAGTPSTCINGDTNKRLAINMAKGSDHNIVRYETSPPDPVINDHAACPNTGEEVNELRIETGSPTGALTDGLFNGVSGNINGEPITSSPGRLVCDTATYSDMCANVRGRTIDHTGLWKYLTPGSCTPTPSDHEEMKDCVENGSPSFEAEIFDHPRFAAIPIFHTTPTGPGNYRIDKFIPVWLEKTYYDCNASKCDTVHTPGEIFDPLSPPGNPAACPATLTADVYNCGWTDSGSLKLGGLTALLLDINMLPADMRDDFPGIRHARTYALTE